MLDNIKRIISIVLAISLLWQDRGKAVPRVQPFVNSPQPLSIFIPEQYGSIEKTNSQTGEQANRQTVVLIKDAHCNYEAQTNIARILETLIRDYKIDLVCVEGASGEVDTTIFASYPDKKVREKIADKYVKKGYLSASEALSIARSKSLPFSIYGIEDTGLYLENFKGFRNTIGNGKETARYIELLKNIINILKPRIYNERLMEFDKKQVEYEENKLSLTEWIRYINTWLAITKTQKNLHLSLRAIQLEEDIDFSVVESERGLLIKELEKSSTKEELKELIEKSLLFRLGRLSSCDYYTYLEKTSRSLLHKKNLRRYIHLVKLQSGVEGDGLFREIEELEDRIRETLFNNEIERQLNRIARNTRILNKLYSLTLTRDELAYYKDNKPEFSPQKVLPFITVQARINNITIPPELNDVDFLDKVEEFIQPAEFFYKKAIERDTTMVNNLLVKMEKDKKEKAVIVVGGFHSEGIIKKLQENGISYTVITPKITKAQGDSRYIDIMMDEKIDVDRIMAELGIENIAPALLTSDLGQRFFGHMRQAMASEEVRNTTIENLIRKFPETDQDSLTKLFGAAGISPETRLVDLGTIFTKEYTPSIIKRKITAARHPLTKSFWIEMLRTALGYEGKDDETIEKEIKNILEIDSLATGMADSDKKYHAHGTNAMALKTLLDPRFDGILFPGYDIRERGGIVLSGETGGLSNANNLFFVSTINLSHFHTEIGVRVGYLSEAIDYARHSSSTEPRRLIFRIAPDSIDEAILKLKKFVRYIKEEGYSYNPFYIGFIRRLDELRKIKRYFKGLSQEERDEINKLSKIPVVIIGYDSGKGKAPPKMDKEIKGEDLVQQLTTTIVATTSENVNELSELLKRSGREKDIRVISIEEAELLQNRYLTTLGMKRSDFGEPQIGQMKVIGRRDPMDEDTELDLTDRHAEFEEKAEGVLIEDVFGINAKVIQADLGRAGAYHFISTAGGYIIVVNSNYAADIQEEGKYHEAREIYWMSQGFSQHDAHIIASAEQIQHFYKEGELTPYHLVLIQMLTPDESEAIKQEDEKAREYHHKVLEKANSAGAGIDIQRIKDYETLLRNKAMSIKRPPATVPTTSASTLYAKGIVTILGLIIGISVGSPVIGLILGLIIDLFGQNILKSVRDLYKKLSRKKKGPGLSLGVYDYISLLGKQDQGVKDSLREKTLRGSSIGDLVERFGVAKFIELLNIEKENILRPYEIYLRGVYEGREALVPEVRKELDPLIKGIESIRGLLEEGIIDLDKLKQVVRLCGHSIERACTGLNELTEVIRRGGLDYLIELAASEDGALKIKLPGTDNFSWLLGYKDLLIQYGVIPFILLARSLPRGILPGIPVREAFSLIQRVRKDVLDKFGIDFVCAVVCAFKEKEAKENLFIFADSKGLIERVVSFLDDLDIQAIEKQEDDLGKRIFFLKSFLAKYGLENFVLFTQSISPDQAILYLESLQPVIDQIGIEPFITLSKRHKNALYRLINLDWEIWSQLLLQQGKIGDSDLALTQHHLGNLSVIAAASPNIAISLLGKILDHRKQNERLNFIEDFLLHTIPLDSKVKEKLSNYLANEKSNIKRVLITRGLFWIYSGTLQVIDINTINAIIIRTRPNNLAEILNFIPTCDILIQNNIITLPEFREAIESDNLIRAVTQILSTRIEEAFDIKFKEIHPDAQDALSDTDFLVDLFNFRRRYEDAENAYNILRDLVKAFFENGREGILEYKRSHELSEKQAPKDIRGRFFKLSRLKTPPVREDKESDINLFDQFFKNTLDNYDRHLKEYRFDIEGITKEPQQMLITLNERIDSLISATGNNELRQAITERDLPKLKSLEVKGKDERIRNQAIGLIQRINALQQENILKNVITIIEEIRAISQSSPAEQGIHIQQLFQKYSMTLQSMINALSAIRRQLEEKNKPEAQIISEMIGMLQALEKAALFKRESISQKYVTAEVSFDLKETLKIGRYGNSGQGNCQSSTQPGSYNLSLMSFIGDAHELIILLRDEANRVIGFALFHGVYLENGEFVYVREKVYTNNNSISRLQEDAVTVLCRKIAKVLHIKILDPTMPKENFDIVIPRSYVHRYLDFQSGTVSISEHHTKLSASVISPVPTAGQMKVIGRRDPMDEDTELDLTDRHAEFEEKAKDVLPDDRYGIRVIQADLGRAGAYHFKSTTGEYIIVVNSNYTSDIQEEGKYHEAREIYWMSQGFSQHDAHIIASAEQVQRFSPKDRDGNIVGLTAYHIVQLQGMTESQLKEIVKEDENFRRLHHRVLGKAKPKGARINIKDILNYEKLIRSRATQELRLEGLKQTLRALGDLELPIDLKNKIMGLIIDQEDKTSKVAFLAPDADHIARIIENVKQLVLNPQIRDEVEKRFGDKALLIAPVAALLSKIGFGHDGLKPDDRSTYRKNRIFAMEILKTIEDDLKTALGLNKEQFLLFKEAILREGTFGIGTERRFEDFQKAMQNNNIDITGMARDKYTNPLTSLLTVASELDISQKRLQYWQRDPQLLRALSRVYSNPLVVALYTERNDLEIQKAKALSTGDYPGLEEINRDIAAQRERFNKALRDIIAKEIINNPEIMKLKNYEEIKTYIQGIDSESYLWYVSSFCIEDIEIRNGRIIIGYYLDQSASLGAAANEPYVRDFHYNRLEILLNEINEGIGLGGDSALILKRKEVRRNNALYTRIQKAPKAELHAHLKMSVDFDLIWGEVLRFKPTAEEPDRQRAYSEAIGKSQQLLEKLGIIGVDLEGTFDRARRAVVDLQKFIGASDLPKDIDQLVSDAQRFLIEGKARSLEERIIIQKTINQYNILKHYVRHLFNFQEGALPRFVVHFMAASNLLKISREDELATLKKITKEMLEGYQADNVAYVETRFNIGKDKESTLSELLTVIAAHKEWTAGKDESLVPRLRIILSITKFADQEKPIEEREAHKTNSARIFVQILEEAQENIDNQDYYKGLTGDTLVTPRDVLNYLHGIDAAGQEEYNPPSLFREAYKLVHQYNEGKTEGAEIPPVVLTHHVSESITDVSIESGIRYSVEAITILGMHRLGHNIIPALANFRQFLNTVRTERVSERIAQIKFDLELLREGIPLLTVAEESLMEELHDLKSRDENDVVTYHYDSMEKIIDLQTRAGYALDLAISHGVLIETNPTSNLGVSPYIHGYGDHTLKTYLRYTYGNYIWRLKKYLEKQLEVKEDERLRDLHRKTVEYLGSNTAKENRSKKAKVTINTDDLTLFGTSMTEEFYRMAEALGISWKTVLNLVENAFKHTKGLPQAASEAIGIRLERLRAIMREREIADNILKRYADTTFVLAREIILDLMVEGRRQGITYHNERHFNELFEFLDSVLDYGKIQFLDPVNGQRLIRLAIYFHDMGYFYSDDDLYKPGHEDRSKEILERFQDDLLLTKAEVKAVQYLIDKTKFKSAKEGFDQEILRENRAYMDLQKASGKADLSQDTLDFVKEHFGDTVNLDNPSDRQLVMDAILGGRLIAVADVYGQAEAYPYMVALLQPEFKHDNDPATKPTRFDQIANTPSFLTTYSVDSRLRFVLGVDSKGNTVEGVSGHPLVLDEKIPAGLKEKRQRNIRLMERLAKQLFELRNGIDIERNIKALRQFAYNGYRMGIFNRKALEGLRNEINLFSQEGRRKKALIIKVLGDEGLIAGVPASTFIDVLNSAADLPTQINTQPAGSGAHASVREVQGIPLVIKVVEPAMADGKRPEDAFASQMGVSDFNTGVESLSPAVEEGLIARFRIERGTDGRTVIIQQKAEKVLADTTLDEALSAKLAALLESLARLGLYFKEGIPGSEGDPLKNIGLMSDGTLVVLDFFNLERRGVVEDIVKVIGEVIKDSEVRINRERLQQILGQVSPERPVTLQDILKEIDGTELSIEEIITLGDKISRLQSLQDLLGKDTLHRGGQLVLSILREIVIGMGGRVGDEEDPLREFQRILRENLGIVDSESQSIFELIERLFHVLEYDPILGITKVDNNFYDLIDKIAQIAGTSDTAILMAVGRGSLRYQLGKKFEENLVEMALSKNITPDIEKTLRAKGIWGEFENLKRLMDNIKERRAEKIDNLDSPFFDLIKQLEFYIVLKTKALARIETEDPQLYNDPAVQRTIKGTDFPDAVIIDNNTPTAQAQRFSESNAISKRMGDLIKKDDIQRVISVPIDRVFPDLDNFIRQAREGKQRAELSYAPGLAPLFRLTKNVKVILRVRDIDETKRQIIEGLIRIAGLEGNVLVREEIDNVEQLEKEHSSIVDTLGVKAENIVFFTDKDLTEGIRTIQDRIKNNEIKVFGIDEDSQLPAILILGYTASSVSVFSEGILSGAIRDVLKTLGMPEGEIDEMVRRGDIFIKVRLIRITQTLQEFRMRRIAIDIAA